MRISNGLKSIQEIKHYESIYKKLDEVTQIDGKVREKSTRLFHNVQKRPTTEPASRSVFLNDVEPHQGKQECLIIFE